MVRSLPE